MTGRTTTAHFDFDRDSKQASIFMLVVGTIAFFAWMLFAAQADAQDFGPERPVQHQDAALHQLLLADQIAYTKADRAYVALTNATAVYDAADNALNTAIETGESASSPAENLGGLAQDLVNARVAKEAAQSEFDLEAASLATARAAYEAAVTASIPEETATVEADLEAEQKARIDALETQLLALKTAVCHGHSYAHDHSEDYTAICSEEDQTADTTTEKEVAPE